MAFFPCFYFFYNNEPAGRRIGCRKILHIVNWQKLIDRWKSWVELFLNIN